MKEQIELIERTFQFLENEFDYEYFVKSPSNHRICKSINYYRNYLTIEIQLHKNGVYFYVNVISEKDESFTITSFNNKMIFCDDLNLDNLDKAKIKLLSHLKQYKP